MKKEIINIMKKTSILQIIHRFLHVSFLLYTAYILSVITSSIQASMLSAAIARCFMLIVLWIIYGILMVFINHGLLVVRTEEQLCVRENFIKRLLHSSLKAEEYDTAGMLLENLSSDIGRITKHYGESLPVTIVTAISAVIYLGVSGCLCPLAGLAMLILSFLELIPHVVIKHFLMKSYVDCREIEAEVTNVFISGYEGAEEIKVYGALPWLNKRLHKKHKEYEKIGMKSESAYTGEIMISSLIEQIVKYGFFALLGLLFLKKMITAPAIAAIVIISADFFAGMNTLFQIIPEFAIDRVAYQRLNKWKGLHSIIKSKNAGIVEGNNNLFLHMDNITIKYGEKYVFHNDSIAIPLLKKTAIVGDNGSGKTTLLKMVLGMLNKDAGNIWSDQGYWEELTQNDGIVYLPQDCPELSFTAEDLIQLNDWREFKSIAKQFGLKEISFQEPLNKLSGGQRKKIYLAAVFCTHALLLLLDEPSNELDETGKAALMDLMISYPYGILYVTHEEHFLKLAEVRVHTNAIEQGAK